MHLVFLFNHHENNVFAFILFYFMYSPPFQQNFVHQGGSVGGLASLAGGTTRWSVIYGSSKWALLQLVNLFSVTDQSNKGERFAAELMKDHCQKIRRKWHFSPAVLAYP